jgi:hypothetical protein
MTTSSRPRPYPTLEDAGPIIWSRRRRLIAWLVLAAVFIAATGALLFGPARGARDDLSHVRHDLRASRSGIFQTVRILTGQLETTQRLLLTQERGLSVAKQSQRIARTTSQHTADLLQETATMVSTIRQVLAALGPLRRLRGDINDVVAGVRAGVHLAESTLSVARQTLATGQAALQTALATLRTLQQSRDIQAQQLQVARETLRETENIDRKIPSLPIFPAARTTTDH